MAGLNLDKLSAAKLWLISDSEAGDPTRSVDRPCGLPYLAHALYALVPVPSREVATMSCDEHWRIYVNPDWLDVAPVPFVGSQLAHMAWHLLLDHANRARDLGVDAHTATSWTNASDATIVHTLDPEGIRCPGLTSADDLGLTPGQAAEQYYAALSRLPALSLETPEPSVPNGCGSGADGLRRSHELPPDLDIGEVRPEDADEIRRRIAIEYREHLDGLGRGDQPGDALRWVKQILEPRIAWEPLLSGAVRRAVGWTTGRTDYTHTRPSRRQSAMPRIVVPGMRRPIPRVAMVIDTSGSVDDGLLSRALGEVDGALRSLGIGGGHVTVLACDAAVHQVARVRRARDAQLGGGGGTDMRVGLAAAAAQRPRPDLIVVFTDGETPWPQTAPPGTLVIAALLGRHRSHLPLTPAWARRVECVLE